MSATAERVTYWAEDAKGKRVKRTVAILTKIRETTVGGEPAIVGTEVDKEGATLDRVHIVSTACITKRVPLVMSNTYGFYIEQEGSR